MAVNKGEIGIYGVLRRDGGDNILARTDQIQDVKTNKTQEQLNLEALNKAAIAAAHIANTENPHSVSKSQVGLGNVSNDALVKRTEMGKPLGVATLDGLGRVLSSQLPSYVDDVLEYSNKSAFPTTGETGKIYVDTTTNLTYRWSGSQYVEISQSLALGETSSTAYSGDKGKATTDKVNTHVANTDNPHNVTKAQVGLSNVDNTSDLDKPVSTATQTELDKKVDKVEGKGLSTEDYTTADKTKLAGIASGAQVNSIIGVKGGAEESYRTGNVNITAANLGLGNVNNTSDANKPVSTAQQTALDKKVDKTTTVNGHALSGNVTVTKADVGLGNVDNTSDLNKPISTATQTALDNKADINDLSNVLAEEVLDESNFPEVNTYTREELKKDLFIDIWNTACGKYGQYNAATGYFELNGLTDITYQEALLIDAYGIPSGDLANKYSGQQGVRTYYPYKVANLSTNAENAFNYNTFLVVFNGSTIKSTKIAGMFQYCINLRSVQAIDVVNTGPSVTAFKDCYKLETLKIIRLGGDMNVQWSPLLTLSSFQSIVHEAINKSPITITVHPDVYAKLTGDTTNAAAAALTPEELAQWQQVLTDGLQKGIQFTTI